MSRETGRATTHLASPMIRPTETTDTHTTVMQHNNQIGILADKIVAVKINRLGTLTPMLRRRALDGRMIECSASNRPPPTLTPGCEFIARVPSGSSGFLAVRSIGWPSQGYSSVIIPVGSTRPFEDFDASVPESDGSPVIAAESAPTNDEVSFQYLDDKLTWKNGNTSGEMRIDASYPELMVSLRLPPGNEGEISFASPIFTNANGELASVLAVA